MPLLALRPPMLRDTLRVAREPSRARGRCPGFHTDLLVRAGRGDESCLGPLIDLFYPSIAAILRPHAVTRSVEDLAVGCFAHLWSATDSYEAASRRPVQWVIDQVQAYARDLPDDVMPTTAMSRTGARRRR